MKKQIFIIHILAVCFLSSSTCLAEMSLNYDANTYARAHAWTFEDVRTVINSATSINAICQCHASAGAGSRMLCGGQGKWEYFDEVSDVESIAEGLSDTNGITIYSRLHGWGRAHIFSDCSSEDELFDGGSGNGYSRMTGSIDLGNSNGILDINAQIIGSLPSSWESWNWQLKIWADDANNPLVILNDANTDARFYIIADQNLNFEFYHEALLSEEYGDWPSSGLDSTVKTSIKLNAFTADLDKNWYVDFFDFAIAGENWSLHNDPCDVNLIPGDITEDSYVDFEDLLKLAEAWLCCFIEPASNPNPVDGKIEIEPNVILGWTAGTGTLEHDVYLGTDANAVVGANRLSAEFMGTVSDANLDISPLGLGTTYFWRIDEAGPGCTTSGTVWTFTTLPPLPGQATVLVPANGAIDVSRTQDLSWTAGSGATSHDVYFGTVNPPPFKVNQTGTTYDTGTMQATKTHYWRIDEKNAGGTTTGITWSFTTLLPKPGKATNPVPGNGFQNLDPNTVLLSWTAGSYAHSHDVYFGTDFNDVNNADILSSEFKGNQTATSYDPCDLEVNTTYFWRIDEKNISGTTKGNVWKFNTFVAVIAPNCVGWWKFDDGIGTVANDSAGDNNGTIYGGAAWITGQINGALSFYGYQYVEISDDDDSLDMDNQMTISAWIKVNNFDDYQSIVNKQPSGTAGNSYPGNYEFRIDKITGYLYLLHQTTTGYTLASYESTSTVTAGVWQNVAVTLQEGAAVKFYINGSPAGTSLQTETFGIVNNEPVRIGKRKDGYTLSFHGTMDDVRIYNRALSDGEILQLYNEGLNP